MKQIKIIIRSIEYALKLTLTSSKLLVIPYLLTCIVTVTAPLLNIYIMKNIIDAVVADEADMQLIMLNVLLYVGVLILTQASSSAYFILSDSLYQKSAHEFNTGVLEKMSRLPLSVLDTSANRDLLDQARNAEWSVCAVMRYIVNAISCLPSFFAAFAALISFNVWISLLFVFLSIPGVILDAVYERKKVAFIRKSAPDMRRFCYYRWMLTDLWPAKDVRMYDLTEPVEKRYNEEKVTYRDGHKTLGKKVLKSSLATEIIKRSGEIVFLIFVIFQALDGKLTIGEVALYTGLIATALSSFQNTANYFSWLLDGAVNHMKPVFEFDEIPCPDDVKGTRELGKFESLAFDNVCFKYPLAEKYVLQGASFTLNSGDKLSIVGINGAGKSTIIKLMLGLYTIESGQILINGFPMSDYDIKDVRKMFSALFQSFVQYPLTLRDNVALSDLSRRDSDDEIIEALKLSGIYENYDKFEDGLESYMTRQFADNGTELSKGQWQKIALSRVYFKNADIVIFDEPSSALDAEAEDMIFRNFAEISANKTGIMISHRISSARMANKVIVLDGGVIAESGTHDELVAANGIYANLYNLQREKYTIKEDADDENEEE